VVYDIVVSNAGPSSVTGARVVDDVLSLGQITGACEVLRDAMSRELDVRKCITKSLFDQADCEVSYINTNPLASKLFSSMHGGAAPAEWIKDYITFIRGRGYDPLQQCNWLLSRVSQSLSRDVI